VEKNIQYPLRFTGDIGLNERAAVEASRGFWINCSVALHNFPE